MKKKNEISKTIFETPPIFYPNKSPKDLRFLFVLKYPNTIKPAVKIKLATIIIFSKRPDNIPT